MLVFTPAPLPHTGHPDNCARCAWFRLHYNLIHHVRTRGEYKV